MPKRNNIVQKNVPINMEGNNMTSAEFYRKELKTSNNNAFCKNVKRKGYIYADYIGETIN